MTSLGFVINSGSLSEKIIQSIIIKMRVILEAKERILLFNSLKDKGLSNSEIATLCKVSSRSIRAWRNSATTIPKRSFDILLEKCGLSENEIRFSLVDDWWNNSVAGSKGAATRMEKYGNPGTTEGRQKGGKATYRANKDDPDGIFALNQINKPAKSTQLAEFVGLMIGDGGITKYQISITTNSIDDREYTLFIVGLIEDLFGVQPSAFDRNDSNCTRITVSSKLLADFLIDLGLPRGHKNNQGLDIPSWIKDDKEWSHACLRGIFDTDGGVYQERHKRKNKMYCYTRLSFVSMSPQLRSSVHKILVDDGYSAKIRSNRAVNLESESDIRRYFTEIGTSNPKHERRYKQFGGVG